MYGHLVSVEVGVERGTYQRVKLDGSALYQYGFKCLNRKSMQRRRTVQKNGMLLDNVFQRVPYARILMRLFDLLESVLDTGDSLHFFQSLDYEGLEQLQRHFLGKSALIDLQGRTDDDNRTSRIVYALTQKVLTEASLLTAKHFGKRLQRTVGGARNGLSAASVIDQRVYRLLQHPLLVADNDLGSVDLDDLL